MNTSQADKNLGPENSLKIALSGNLDDFQINVDLNLPPKGITALFGPSGGGKTTLLRAIAGLTKLRGQVSIPSAVWQDDSQNIFLPTYKRRLGYVFQEASLFPHLSVKKNLLFACKKSTPAPYDLKQILDWVNIAHLLDRSPHTLSGGERQRVAVGRALMRGADLLLMDEPLSALDHQNKESVLTCLERLHRDLDIPILYVSHDINEVTRLADHLVLIENGQVTRSGPTARIFSALDFTPPEGRFHTSVLLKAKAISHHETDGLAKLQIGDQTLTCPPLNSPIGQDISLRIRARDVAVATIRPEGISIRNILSGRVVDIRCLPDAAHVELKIDIGGGFIRSQITRDAFNDLRIEKDQDIFALIKSMSFEDNTG